MPFESFPEVLRYIFCVLHSCVLVSSGDFTNCSRCGQRPGPVTSGAPGSFLEMQGPGSRREGRHTCPKTLLLRYGSEGGPWQGSYGMDPCGNLRAAPTSLLSEDGGQPHCALGVGAWVCGTDLP